MLGHFFSTFFQSEPYHEDPPACSAPERATPAGRKFNSLQAPGIKKPGSEPGSLNIQPLGIRYHYYWRDVRLYYSSLSTAIASTNVIGVLGKSNVDFTSH